MQTIHSVEKSPCIGESSAIHKSPCREFIYNNSLCKELNYIKSHPMESRAVPIPLFTDTSITQYILSWELSASTNTDTKYLKVATSCAHIY